MENNNIDNIANEAAILEEFLNETYLGIFNVKGIVSDYEMWRERKLSKKFDYDFTKDIKAAIERGKKIRKTSQKVFTRRLFSVYYNIHNKQIER